MLLPKRNTKWNDIIYNIPTEERIRKPASGVNKRNASEQSNNIPPAKDTFVDSEPQRWVLKSTISPSMINTPEKVDYDINPINFNLD